VSYKTPARKKPGADPGPNAHARDEADATGKSIYSSLEPTAEPKICPALAVSADDAGLSYFMSSFVPGSHFAYLPLLYNDARTDCPLYEVVHAASTATLARETHEQSFMETARKHYAKALALTNGALRNSSTAVKDSTLASVILLSVFEAIVWDGYHTPSNWTIHTRGALALVKMRGEEQFRTETGRQLFWQVRNRIFSGCIQRHERVPTELARMTLISAPYYEPDNPKLALAKFIPELTDLLADIREQRITPSEVAESAQRLDQKLVQIIENSPPLWQYTETRIEGDASDEAYGETVYLYPNHHVAQLWNSYRMTRLCLNAKIHNYAPLIPASTTQLQKTAKENITLMATGICASTPPFTRLSPSSSFYKASIASLLWPLVAVRAASRAPEVARKFSEGRLRHLGDELKILPSATSPCDGSREKDVLQNGYICPKDAFFSGARGLTSTQGAHAFLVLTPRLGEIRRYVARYGGCFWPLSMHWGVVVCYFMPSPAWCRLDTVQDSEAMSVRLERFVGDG